MSPFWHLQKFKVATRFSLKICAPLKQGTFVTGLLAVLWATSLLNSN